MAERGPGTEGEWIMESDWIRGFASSTVLLLVILGLTGPGDANAHCDTMSGPVIDDARRALESGTLTPIEKWIRAEDEPELRTAFEATLSVRKLNDTSRELADRYFFETLVRVHRAGEGAPYEGLKPAEATPPVIVAADQALASGSVGALAGNISAAVAAAVEKRFDRARELRFHAEESPEAGRLYVAAYVDYVHFVEAVDGIVGADAETHETGEHSHGH
jgi:hypothetical protein